MSDPLRIGALGIGKHAEKTLRACKELTSTQFTTLAASSSEKADRLRSEFPELKVVSSYRDLVSDPEIDAVYVALPNSLHAEWCVKAFKNGKHVICEKPLGLNLEEAATVNEAAERSGKKLLEAFMYRFHPQHAEVKRLLASGTLGEPRLFEAHFHYFMNDKRNIRLQADLGGGGLLDVGCYLLDAVHFLFGVTPKRLSGGWQLDAETGCDVAASLQLICPNGLHAQLTCGTLLPRANAYTIYCAAGTVRVPNAFRVESDQKTTVEIQPLDGPGERITFQPFNQIAEQFEQFGRWVRGDAVDEALFSNGLETVKLLDAARVSCAEEREIQFEPRQH